MTHRGYIRHVVLFSAKDKKDIPKIMDGLNLLREIPHARTFEVSRSLAMDSLANETDIVVYAEFADTEALKAYQDHPLYHKAIAQVRPLRELRIASDF